MMYGCVGMCDVCVQVCLCVVWCVCGGMCGGYVCVCGRGIGGGCRGLCGVCVCGRGICGVCMGMCDVGVWVCVLSVLFSTSHNLKSTVVVFRLQHNITYSSD